MAKKKIKGFDLFAEMRKKGQTFADRSDALNSAVGSDTTVSSTTQTSSSVEEQAVIALTNAVKEYKTTIKGGGLGKKTIDGFKEVVRDTLGVKRMGDKKYQSIISLCDELEVITKDSGRKYFSLIEKTVEEVIEDDVEEYVETSKSDNETDKKVVALFEQYLKDKDNLCDEEGEFVSTCTSCGSYKMELYLDSKKKLRCCACNDLHWEDSYHLFPQQVSSSNRSLIACVTKWGKKSKKGIKHKGWLVTKENLLVRVGK